MVLTFISAFLLVRYIQSQFKKTPVLYGKWSQLFQLASLIIIILAVATNVLLTDWMQDIISGLVLLGLVYYIEKEPDLSPMYPFASTHIPLGALSLIYGIAELIVPEDYHNWKKFCGFAILAAFVWTFARKATFRKQQKEFDIVKEQKDELEALVAARTAELTNQRNELQEIVKELKATQAQLVQQEKLASLGELTAGIAHEIQNPLNFVNNFSEVSVELLDEMEEELNNGETEEVLAIAADLKQNLEKIRHHGKRADGIVKGMLQHSRMSSGQKEPADLNALADEYLRLSYHGLRAKDKSFNAEMITHLDTSLPKVNMVAQDVGRVLLNLFTNAFYAVNQKKKTAGFEYKPVVEVTTHCHTLPAGSQEAVITVKDNGTGISDAVKDKIMQPFFTTKPTGEGTGLGLSLSYDIIVKGHGGTINVSSVENEYTQFVITLPLIINL